MVELLAVVAMIGILAALAIIGYRKYITSAKIGSAWMGSSYPGGVQVPRGPWYYDGEIDLGFGGALRMARLKTLTASLG